SNVGLADRLEVEYAILRDDDRDGAGNLARVDRGLNGDRDAGEGRRAGANHNRSGGHDEGESENLHRGLSESIVGNETTGEVVFAADVGEAHFAALEEVGELAVVEAEEGEDGGVGVVDVDLVLDGAE